MRKLLLLVSVLLLPLMVTKAQDTAIQTAIVVFVDGKIYAVSPDDGSAWILAEASNDNQALSPLRIGSLSPDGQKLVYVSQSAVGTPSARTAGDLFVVQVMDGTAEKITPSGGIFDSSAGKGSVFQIGMPTWSADGQRIYYFRQEYDGRSTETNKPTLFAYYDIKSHKHQVVARIDPTHLIDNIQAVEHGMVLRWYEPGFSGSTFGMFYKPNNQMVKEIEISTAYPYMMQLHDAAFYARLNDFGDIQSLVNAETGEEKQADVGYYPVEEGLVHGDQSIHVFNLRNSLDGFDIYGADNGTYITKLDVEYGFDYALSPDGQSMAYLQLDVNGESPIHIINMKGDVRELGFRAEQILWGAMNFVPFFLPG